MNHILDYFIVTTSNDGIFQKAGFYIHIYFQRILGFKSDKIYEMYGNLNYF